MGSVWYAVVEGPRIVRAGSCPASMLEHVQAEEGQQIHVVADGVRPSTHWWDGTQPQPLPERPSPRHQWDAATASWVISLEDARALKWEEIKTARDEAEFAAVVHAGHTFDADEESQRRLMGACLLAQVDSSATWDWTTADNAVVTLSAAEIIALGAAVAAQVAAAHATGRALRAQIEAATTEAEIDLITWP